VEKRGEKAPGFQALSRTPTLPGLWCGKTRQLFLILSHSRLGLKRGGGVWREETEIFGGAGRDGALPSPGGKGPGIRARATGVPPPLGRRLPVRRLGEAPGGAALSKRCGGRRVSV
jgi:hypothetical protein